MVESVYNVTHLCNMTTLSRTVLPTVVVHPTQHGNKELVSFTPPRIVQCVIITAIQQGAKVLVSNVFCAGLLR